MSCLKYLKKLLLDAVICLFFVSLKTEAYTVRAIDQNEKIN